MSTPQLRLYKDESLTSEQLEKINELYALFKDDNPKWLSRQECLNLKNSDTLIVVFNVFEGAAFEHLKKLNTRIVSAQCMMSSLKSQKKLPRSDIPLYSLAMTNLNVCCSNVEKKLRDEIYRKVEMMRGKTTGIFTEQVTHLVTNEVGSSKYHAAGGVKMPIMLPEWVFDVWRISENKNIHASDAEFLKHKCPIFHKLVICASGYSDTTKKELKSLIESAGGTYKGDLVCGTTTHLVINEPKGQKYDHAKMWKINIVSSAWVHDSIKEQYCLPEKKYAFSDNQTSTPTSNDSRIVHKTKGAGAGYSGSGGSGGNVPSLSDIDVSVINKSDASLLYNQKKEGNKSVKCINDTEHEKTQLSTTMNNTTIVTGFSNAFQTNTKTVQPLAPTPTTLSNTKTFANNYSDILKELNTIGKMNRDLFDGTGIYCENFDVDINEKLKKLVNLGGGIRFDEYNSDVTHVIANQVNDKQCKIYIEQNPEVNIVKIDWFVKSCKENQLAECKTYCVFKNALNSVKTPKKRTRPEKPTTSVNANASSDLLSDCLSQYMKEDSSVTSNIRPQLPLAPRFDEKIQIKMRSFNDADKTASPSSFKQQQQQQYHQPMPKYEHKNKIEGVFSNKRFHIWGFDEIEIKGLESVLLARGADIVMNPEDYSDFTLYPATIPEAITENNSVTVYWMRKCIEQNKIIDLADDIFFQPIPRYNDDKPLEDAVITVSGYASHEKENIVNFCNLLGAYVQQSLSLKNQANGIKGNTHLISKQMNGPKYTAAKSWKKPVVTPEWLVECCITGIKADEAKYLIENKYSYNDLMAFAAKVRKNEPTQTNSSFGSGAGGGTNNLSRRNLNNDSTLAEYLNSSNNHRESGNNQEEGDETTHSMDLSLSFHNESKKPRLDHSTTKKDSIEYVNNMEHSDKNNKLTRKNNNDTENEDDDDMKYLAAIENTEQNKKTENRNSNTPPMVHHHSNLQVTNNVLCNPRLKELKKIDAFQTPTANSPSSELSINRMSLGGNSAPNSPSNNVVKTPLWLKPKGYKPTNGEQVYSLNIDVENAMEFLKTPDGAHRKQQISSKPETPLDELFTNAIHIAKENSKKASFYTDLYQSPDVVYNFESNPRLKGKLDEIRNKASARLLAADMDESRLDQMDEPMSEDHALAPTQPPKKQILKNVHVYVCKLFQKEQVEFYDLVVQLGGNFLWNYNSSCTHFIYSGHINDNNSELNTAKKENKIIVTPEWLYECQIQNERVSESLYLIENLTNDETEHEHNENEEQMAQDDVDEENEDRDKTNETNDEENTVDNVKQLDIPDSMAIKYNFVEQLSDKLAIIKNNKKWSKNNSGNLLTTNTTPISAKTTLDAASTTKTNYENQHGNTINNNSEFLSDTDLLNAVDLSKFNKKNPNDDLNELNKSKSKWGVNCGSEATSKSDLNSNSLNNKNMEDSDELNPGDISRKISKRKAGSNFTRYKTDTDADKDELGNLPNLTGKKSSEANVPPPSSQIQVTLWNDDSVGHGKSGKTLLATNGTRSTKTALNQSEQRNKPKNDPITDRILNAAKAASTRMK